jgi:selenocysteine-specific elongation factor
LLAHFATEQLLSPQQWKVLCEVSRKFAIPLIEYFDAEKLTLRVGDNRKLRNRSS